MVIASPVLTYDIFIWFVKTFWGIISKKNGIFVKFKGSKCPLVPIPVNSDMLLVTLLLTLPAILISYYENEVSSPIHQSSHCSCKNCDFALFGAMHILEPKF